MERRTLLKGLLVGTAMAGSQNVIAARLNVGLADENSDALLARDANYLAKLENYNTHFPDDVVLTDLKLELLQSVVKRLSRVQSTVGHANFCFLSFDQALFYARRFPDIGAFPQQEKTFLDNMFYTNAKDYGFFGEKVTNNIASVIERREIKKIRGTGNYLFRDASIELYEKIRNDIGQSIILTSGVRGVVKQMHLFLAKATRTEGNLSMASRSLAPPGYSFHANGDFDVGKVGYGQRNFTEEFSKTDEYKRLEELGYIRMRYHKKNPFGVRFEPWHVKVSRRV